MFNDALCPSSSLAIWVTSRLLTKKVMCYLTLKSLKILLRCLYQNLNQAENVETISKSTESVLGVNLNQNIELEKNQIIGDIGCYPGQI